MTSADEKAKAAMRAYADNLQPPPVADIIARAEDTGVTAQPTSTGLLRSRGRLVLAAASVIAAITVVAIAADQLTDRGTTAATQPAPITTAATQPAPSTGPAGMAPGCPPGLPVLEGPLTVEGTLLKPIAAKAGQQLTLPVQIPPADPDRRLRSFQIYLLPAGVDMNESARAVAESPVLQLESDQDRVAPIVQVPAGLVPGSYDIVGYATFPSPSVCGVKNRVDETQVGSIGGVLGSVVIS